MSVIYTELKRLEEQGYVSARDVPTDEVRHKRVYGITPEGRAALAQWVRTSPVETPSLKHSVAFRVWLGDLVEPEVLTGIVEEHRTRTEAMLEDLRQMEVTTDPGLTYPRLVIRWSQRYWENERAAADQLLRELSVLAKRAGAGRPDGLSPRRAGSTGG
jgi:DNA-binding PadR family transcriptional regulator